MRRCLIAVVLLTACSGAVSTTTGAASSSTTASGPTTSIPSLVECDNPPYRIGEFPGAVQGAATDPSLIDLDVFTSIGGTRSIFWVDAEGNLSLALVRGALPPVDWPGEKGEVMVAGVRGVAGPHQDGKWVVAWYEGTGEERCDLYMLVFYPPVTPDEVEASVASVTRTEE
ncbi:MAG TPA: hypothetical protein VID03_08675 [Acidimicrobiia bacterium]|jgi:hypothetical protein